MITGGFSTFGGLMLPIKRSQLEYPIENVTLAYLAAIGKAVAIVDTPFSYITVDFFADKAVQAVAYGRRGGGLIARRVDINNFYALELGGTLYIMKKVNGATSTIADEGATIYDDRWYDIKISVLGNTLKGYRNDMGTPKVTATDTSIASGAFGVRGSSIVFISSTDRISIPVTSGLAAVLLPPSSPSPKPLAYFEVPVIGSGTYSDPFRAVMPEGELSLTHSALIKTGNDGKPIEYRAIVRIFDQPDRDPSLAPIDKALEALKAIQGVRQLTREQAIARAKVLDDKLTDLDLLSARELRKDPRAAAREYKQWRVFNLGVREELIDDAIMERYADEDKGW